MNVTAEGASPAPPQPGVRPAKPSTGWWVSALLILLGSMPLMFGALRLTELLGGPARMPHNARFLAAPLPIEAHIVSVSVYALLGAFQFAGGLRRRWPGWHRAAGRVVVVSGLLVGLSALWMTLFYPRPEGTGELLYLLRLLFGFFMIGAILLGLAAIRRGDMLRHRAWMTRAYAAALGAGTQVFTGMVGAWVLGKVGVVSGALLMGAGWGINLAVAEWLIRRRPGAQVSRSGAAALPRP